MGNIVKGLTNYFLTKLCVMFPTRTAYTPVASPETFAVLPKPRSTTIPLLKSIIV